MKVEVFVILLLPATLAYPQGRTFVTVDTGVMSLSITFDAGIGFTDPDTGQGHGMGYPRHAPSVLYYGGFLVCDRTGHVHDNCGGQPQRHRDWVVRDTFIDIIPPLFGAHELYRASMVDTPRPTPAVGYLVTHWSGGRGAPLTEFDDFVIVRYDVKNRSDSLLDSVYVGVMCDFDLGTAPTANWGRCDAARRLEWMSPTQVTFNPCIGVKLLEPTSAANLSLIDHALYVYPPGAWNDSTKARFLRGVIRLPNATRAYDYSLMVSAGPFRLPPGEWVRVSFAFIGGMDSVRLKQHADSAQAWYDRDWRTAIEEERSQKLEVRNGLEIHPNPFAKLTKVSFGMEHGAKSIELGIYDVSGAVVRRFNYLTIQPFKKVVWDGTDDAGRPLPAGVYFVRLETPDNNYTKKVLLLR
jgi:hypothetical protein